MPAVDVGSVMEAPAWSIYVRARTSEPRIGLTNSPIRSSFETLSGMGVVLSPDPRVAQAQPDGLACIVCGHSAGKARLVRAGHSGPNGPLYRHERCESTLPLWVESVHA